MILIALRALFIGEKILIALRALFIGAYFFSNVWKFFLSSAKIDVIK
ncbi:hypothetical protein CBE01nite_23240 [Clostridium beijerinckii]|nr:hypothetical protein CBE01nite_23240 [Clostridium beijerinckii]